MLKKIFICLILLLFCQQTYASQSLSASKKIETNFKKSGYEKELKSLNFQFSNIAKEALPAIVNVSSTRTVSVNRMSPFEFFFDSPFFDQQPSNRPQQKRQEKGLGSGFFISSDGYILSNHHVIDGADEIVIILHDGREVKAKVIGSDKKTDVALLKVKGKNYTYFELGDSEVLKVGEWVVAMGNPFSVGITFTTGVISALGRDSVGITSYENFIQTDAAINPGNSGGPLINLFGQVIGINTAIISRSGGYQGIGFAIPINMVKKIKDQLMRTGKVERAFLGVSIQDLNPKFAKSFGLNPDTKGALVNDVETDSPADKAGLKSGDIIIKINNKTIKTSAQLRNTIAFMQAKSKISVTFIRDKKTMKQTVKLSALKEDKIAFSEDKDNFFGSLKLELINDSLRRQYGLPKTVSGALVVNIIRGGKAQGLGFRSGDVILKINNTTINSSEKLNNIIKTVQTPFSCLVYRNGSTFFSLVE